MLSCRVVMATTSRPLPHFLDVLPYFPEYKSHYFPLNFSGEEGDATYDRVWDPTLVNILKRYGSNLNLCAICRANTVYEWTNGRCTSYSCGISNYNHAPFQAVLSTCWSAVTRSLSVARTTSSCCTARVPTRWYTSDVATRSSCLLTPLNSWRWASVCFFSDHVEIKRTTHSLFIADGFRQEQLNVMIFFK